MQRQPEDHALMDGHQLGARRIVARRTPLDQSRFATVDVGPTYGASVLHHCSRIGYMHEV
jgi:hypothetical protein